MLQVVTFKWQPRVGYRSVFDAASVNILRRMVARHYPHPHEFVCVTDNAQGIDPGVRVIPLWPDHDRIPSPHGSLQPSCYRRLKVFSREAATLIGERFVCLDLDTVVTGDLSPLWNRPEDFVIWGETNPRSFYNGSMFLLRAGTHTELWTEFDPYQTPLITKAAGRFGSDQGWISYRLGRGQPMWGRADGVYSFRVHMRHKPEALPPDARLVMCHGQFDPWGERMQALPWVQEHYR